MAKHLDVFTDDFAKNKEILKGLITKGFLEIHSQKLGNIIAGYITKLVKIEKKQK